ncbi:alpha/beta hydrolase [Phycicoccus endophyticus]|uniref:Alpha/beta hydrolase n=1 Tax=Phycicoccus endophyticus TaxID=1690220 RepID=A0A7G9R107_9MICO|nr:alpha/beta hydrolase [Phycicoccus endophyticus]NHI20594.1 alpha/beta hydrolase [Phycicoccus endophyticus]QNN49282.1 alpha/beta hydrolase [Phycicoccus endophyticus]GGL44797.1 hydrolase [Phycicoccus endophyticus]
MPTLDLPDAALDYDLSGDAGPLVVQLHGLNSSRERDERIGLDLGRALRGHRVLRYDARGHGRSSGGTDPRSYTWPRLADDLLALLDVVAPGERVHGLGPSMGSGTLLHAAVRHPERFASLTLAIPPTAWTTRRAQAATYLANAELVEREGLAAFVARAEEAGAPPALADAPLTDPSVPEELLPTVLRGAAATDLPEPEALRELDVPTLVLAWSDDAGHPLSTAALLHELLDDSRLVVARTPYGIMAWPGLFADHVATAGALTARS